MCLSLIHSRSKQVWHTKVWHCGMPKPAINVPQQNATARITQSHIYTGTKM